MFFLVYQRQQIPSECQPRYATLLDSSSSIVLGCKDYGPRKVVHRAMDGVSATASIIAVSSLAFHAAASTKKALDFWDSIQYAPEEVDDIRTGLEILRDVLEQIGHEAQHAPSSPSTLPVLRRCSRKIDSIVSLTTKFESGLKSSKNRTRIYSALRAVLKREKIKKAQDLLSSSKQDLTLVSIYNTR